MLLILQKFGIFLLFRSSAALHGSTSSAFLTLLRLFGIFSILEINLSDDFLDAWVGVGLDEVTEEIGKTEQIAEAANRVIFLEERDRLAMLKLIGKCGPTLDSSKRLCFLPKTLLLKAVASERFLRPSGCGLSPATLLAVVFGLVSESWQKMSDQTRASPKSGYAPYNHSRPIHLVSKSQEVPTGFEAAASNLPPCSHQLPRHAHYA